MIALSASLWCFGSFFLTRWCFALMTASENTTCVVVFCLQVFLFDFQIVLVFLEILWSFSFESVLLLLSMVPFLLPCFRLKGAYVLPVEYFLGK